MKEVRKIVLFIVASLFSSVAVASTCNVNPSDEFKITFDITSAMLTESMTAEKAQGNSTEFVIWTNDESVPQVVDTPYIRDPQYMKNGRDYSVEIIYQPGQGNTPGTMAYYVSDGLGFAFLGDYPANLKDIHPQSVVIDGGTSSNLECDDSDVSPPQPAYSENAKYVFGTTECTPLTSCKIDFINPGFENPPLVFLMPTIDQDALDDDIPSRLVITSKPDRNSTSITFKQDYPADLEDSFTSYPMTTVSYFIMEPGVTIIDGQEVIAGYKSTSKWAKGRRVKDFDTIEYADFGGHGFNDTPVIIHQAQTNNDPDNWFTSGTRPTPNSTSTHVDLFRELNITGVIDTNIETIAFLASEETGSALVAEGGKIAFGLFDSANQRTSRRSLTIGCRDGVVDTPLHEITGILGKKQGRSGNDGGWVRYCRTDGSSAYFAFDEDKVNRKHGSEAIGYLAFERKYANVCPYFPSAVQTWEESDQSGNGKAPLFVQNGSYIKSPFSNEVGFHDNSQLDVSNESCLLDNGNKVSCKHNKNLMIDKPPFNANFPPVNASKPSSNIFTPGSYGATEIKADSEFEPGMYFFESITVQGFDVNLSFSEQQKTMINMKRFEVSGTIKINHTGSPDNLLFMAHGHSAKIALSGDADFHALILSENLVDLAGPTTGEMTITGAITAKFVELDPNVVVIGQSGCFEPVDPPTVARIEIKPNNYHLTCESSPENIVEVLIYDGDDQLVSGYSPDLSEVNGNELDITFISESGGTAQYTVTKNSAGNIGDYNLIASLSLSSGSPITDTDEIKYVPYKFEVDDTYLIAGQDVQVAVDVKACSNDGQLIDVGYVGSPTSSFSYNQPSSALVDTSDLNFTADLNDSNRLADLTFMESGHITVSIEDSSFVCNEERCPVEGGSLKGEFDVYSRPWKIAICNVESDGEDNPASGATGDGFVSAGTNFTVDYRPIAHPDSAAGIADECGYPITSNYSLDYGPLELNFEAVYPDPSLNPQPGIVTPNVIPSFNPNDVLNTLVHTWSEVGSIEFITSAVYLGRDVEEDRQVIGRFYPDYFNTLSNDWEDPVGQTFTYMDQEFEDVAVEVAAYSALGNETRNYGNFDSTQQAFFSLDEGRLLNGDSGPIGLNSSYLGSRWQLNSSDISWQKLADFSPDGPFNFAGGDIRNVSLNIFTATLSDPVQFKTVTTDPDEVTTQLLPDEHPRVVFGRVNLSDVGGVEGSNINVPLQVQYWTDGSFVNNEFDSFTNVDAEIDGNPIVIWPAGGTTTVGLTGSADVEQGIANGLIASQNVATREQVEIFQRLDSGTNDMPWLMFDWDQNGTDEENPSTIVTFGIHRGNDRVIFRGEPGL